MNDRRAAGRELDEPPPATPPNPPQPWYRKPRWQITTVIVVLILIIGVLWWGPWRTVRVTDGSELLANNLAHVQKLILAENNRVTDSGQEWVSVAMMLPIRTASEAPNTLVSIQHELQGAYLAQYWSNHPNGQEKIGNDLPLIKLLIADTGNDGQEWQDTVAQLVKLAAPDSSAHLVAVAGVGRSRAATQDAVDELARHSIPMVGSVITATKLAADGLFRVSPSNSDTAAAAIAYLKTPAGPSANTAAPYKVYLVQDVAKANTFAEDLGREYREEFINDGARTLLEAQGKFDGTKDGVGTALKNLIPEICSIRPRVVLFAGLSHDLRTFLEKLAARPCTDASITVVSGDAARNLTAPLQSGAPALWVEDRANLDVLYTALASPQTWRNYPASVQSATAFRFGECATCFATLFTEPLDDGNAIMAHDAVLTAVTAARNVTTQENRRPTAAALINGFYQINATNPVPGASGWIYFQRDAGGTDVVPYNKAIPIMQLHPDGTANEIALSSRSGTPPTGPQPPQ